METLYCNRCKSDKPIDKFWKNKTIKRGFSYTCTDCINLHYSKRDKESYNKWAKTYRLKQSNKDYEKEFRNKYRFSFFGIVASLLTASKCRSKTKGFDFNLTREWLIEKLKPFKCEVTNLPLVRDKYETTSKKKAHPFAPSIDRIDSSKGYTTDNCRIVCWIYNMAKSNYTDEEVLIMAKALVNSSD